MGGNLQYTDSHGKQFKQEQEKFKTMQVTPSDEAVLIYILLTSLLSTRCESQREHEPGAACHSILEKTLDF